MPDNQDARLTYAAVDQTGAITRQGYCWPDELSTVGEEGEFIHQTTTILNADRWTIDAPGSESSAWVEKLPADPLFDAFVDVDDGNSITLPAASGVTVTTGDEVVHAESGGEITVTFPEGGPSYIRIDQPGRRYRSSKVFVRPMADVKTTLKAQIDAERDARLVAPITVAGISLNGDATSQRNIAEAAIQGAFTNLEGGSYSMQWITLDNQMISLSAAELRAFTDAIAVRRATEYATARTAKDAVMATTTVAAAEAARDAYLAA